MVSSSALRTFFDFLLFPANEVILGVPGCGRSLDGAWTDAYYRPEGPGEV